MSNYIIPTIVYEENEEDLGGKLHSITPLLFSSSQNLFQSVYFQRLKPSFSKALYPISAIAHLLVATHSSPCFPEATPKPS